MKLMIDIDEDIYTRLYDNGSEEGVFDVNADDLCKILTSVRKGVPFSLLIDAGLDKYVVYGKDHVFIGGEF